MLTGSCLCKSVRYTITDDPMDMQYCHCSICRKAHASAFSVGASIPAISFTLIEGEGLLGSYESSAGKHRKFCIQCGTHLFAVQSSKPDKIRLRIATLDSKIMVKPNKHLHVSSKAEWHSITDNLEQLLEH